MNEPRFKIQTGYLKQSSARSASLDTATSMGSICETVEKILCWTLTGNRPSHLDSRVPKTDDGREMWARLGMIAWCGVDRAHVLPGQSPHTSELVEQSVSSYNHLKVDKGPDKHLPALGRLLPIALTPSRRKTTILRELMSLTVTCLWLYNGHFPAPHIFAFLLDLRCP